MTKGPIQPGRILEDFQSLVHGPEEINPLSPSEDTTPTFPGGGTETKYSQENLQQKRLTENPQRPISKIWRS